MENVKERDTEVWSGDHSICTRMPYHRAISPKFSIQFPICCKFFFLFFSELEKKRKISSTLKYNGKCQRRDTMVRNCDRWICGQMLQHWVTSPRIFISGSMCCFFFLFFFFWELGRKRKKMSSTLNVNGKRKRKDTLVRTGDRSIYGQMLYYWAKYPSILMPRSMCSC